MVNKKFDNLPEDALRDSQSLASVGTQANTTSTTIPAQRENFNAASQSNTVDSQGSDAVKFERKIKFWKRFSIVVGIGALVGYILTLVGANISAHQTQHGWVIFFIVGIFWQRIKLVLLILSIVAFVRIIILNIQRKKHPWKDYAVALIGLALIFSQYAVSGILSLFRISWNEDDSISVTVKSKDPYYILGDRSYGGVCIAGNKTSNDLKDVDIDEHYDYVDAERREKFAAETYLETIGEEIFCQVGEFYQENGRYPNEDEVRNFSAQAMSDDVRAGVYDIKLETGEEPNQKDFTILFDKNCSNQRTEMGNVAILSPSYNGEGRYCVSNDIDNIVENLGKTREQE